MELDHKIFIIMPFSQTIPEHTEEYWTSHYEHLLKPSIQGITDLPIERSKVVRTDILRDIIRNLIVSQIVLADITDLNANVMWELGVRQSFRNGTIVIAEEGTQIPFDISIKGMIKYPKLTSDPHYHSEMSKFKENLKIAIDDCVNNPNINDSHVLETISGRGTIFEIISRDETIRKLDALVNEVESNVKLWPILIDHIQTNQQYANNPRGGGVFLTSRFRTHSMELLLTTRYLIQSPEFYSRLQNYLEDLVRLNSQINIWMNDIKSTTAWFMIFQSQFANFDDILSEIKNIKEQILAQS
jgi:hypothetical protein